MKYFVIKLSHDKGKYYLSTAAKDMQTAKNNTMLCEGCPESAIKIKEIPEELFSMQSKYFIKQYWF